MATHSSICLNQATSVLCHRGQEGKKDSNPRAVTLSILRIYVKVVACFAGMNKARLTHGQRSTPELSFICSPRFESLQQM